MTRFATLSISRKLTITSALASGIALLLASTAFLLYDRASVERSMVRRLNGEAEIIGFNSATAILFDDPDSATKTLAALQSDVHVTRAFIHLADGRLFAQYVRPGIDPRLAPAPPSLSASRPAESFERDVLSVTRPILFEARPLGTLIIESSLAERAERFRTYALIVAFVWLAAMGVALAIGRRAQRSVSEPILELAQASRRIAEQSDFAVRAHTRSRDEVGVLVGAFNHMLDGLQRRDEELRKTHAELESRIREAHEANRLKDEFLATLSHELRTPLNAIVGWAHLLRKGMAPAAADRALQSISRNAMAQGQIVADILDMQRIAAGKVRLSLRALELGPVIRAAVDTVSPAAAVKEVELQTVLDEDAGPVMGDEERLQQVLWNLLSNAVKFTPRKGRVRVGLARVDSHVEVTVEDTGPGLPPDFIPYAFDRFRQADSSSTRRHGGLGLGLAIVRNLVELHGGSVDAANRSAGSGALFVVRLPLMSVRPQSGPPAVYSRHPGPGQSVGMDAAPSLHGIRVLVVDDELDSRELVAAALASCGADVVSAASAREALEALMRDPPDVLVSDIEMPDEDGYGLLRQVRLLAPEHGGATPAAALTAYAGTEDRMRALAAGFQIHVPKPVQPAELALVVLSLAQGPVAHKGV